MNIAQAKRACFTIYPTAVSAIENKKRGTSKAKLLASLPSKAELEAYPAYREPGKILGLAMLDIAHQVYQYENLDPQAYAAYSAELCQRKLHNLSVPAKFEESYSQLRKCNSLAEPQQRINCGMAVSGSIVDAK